MGTSTARRWTLAAVAASALAQLLGAGAALAPEAAQRELLLQPSALGSRLPIGRHVDLGARASLPACGYVQAGPAWSRAEGGAGALVGSERAPARGRYVDTVRWGGLAPVGGR